jgi:hypothetical protein
VNITLITNIKNSNKCGFLHIADVTIMGLHIENNRLLKYKHPRERSKYIVWTSGWHPK